MMIDNLLKSALRPTNSGMLNISFWIIAAVILVHLDTFISISEKNANLLEVKNLMYLSLFMLVSVFFLKYGHLTVALFFWEIKSWLKKKKIIATLKVLDNDNGLESYHLLNNSMLTNNLAKYHHYQSIESLSKMINKSNEFFCYLLVVLSFNLLIKGSLYELMLVSGESENEARHVSIFLAVILLFASGLASYHAVFSRKKPYISRSIKESMEDKKES